MPTTTRRSWRFWATPATALVIGFGYLAASLVGGHPADGVFMLSVMVVAAVGSVLFARRSETVRGLMDHRDERLTNIDVTATAAAGMAVIVAVLIAVVVDLARGGNAMPYAWLGAIGGVSYVVAVVVLRVRG
jgi:Kef-type K+ transport system membrane component KefB